MSIDLEFFEALMASLTWMAVKLYTLSAFFCLIFLMVRQNCLVGLLEADGVYCQLRRFTIFPFAETILPLNLRA